MKRPSKRLQILLAVALLLYACGYVTPFIGNYAVWQKNGGMLGGTSPPFPSLTPLACLKGILWFPYSLYCMAGCAAADDYRCEMSHSGNFQTKVKNRALFLSVSAKNIYICAPFNRFIHSGVNK